MALDEQDAYVSFAYCAFEFEGVVACARCTLTRLQLHTHVLFKYTKMATTHGSGLILILLEYVCNGIVLALDKQIVR